MDGSLTPEMRSAQAAGNDGVERGAQRRQLLEARRRLSGHEWVRLSALLREHLRLGFPRLSAMRVGFCWPVHNEPDLRPLLAEWRDGASPGFCALLPVVIAERRVLSFRAWLPETTLRADRHGIPAPADGDFLLPEAVLIPLVGFDAAGYRLGYGGGYFDCTLATLSPRPLAIGVGFELGRVDSIHPAAHDQPLDAIVTEAGVFPASLRDACRAQTNAASSSAGIGRASQ